MRRSVPTWVVAAAAMFVCGWGGNQFTPLLTLYRQADGYSAAVVDALLGAYVLGLAPALLAGGPMSNRHGRRSVVLVGLASSALGSAALAAGTLPLLAAGRMLSGVGVGLGMAVGTAWVTDLTAAAGHPRERGARRASLALTAGFGLGAGVAGAMAQWGPLPATLPYLVQLALAVAVLAAVRRCEDVRPEVPTAATSLRLRIPSLRHPRFRRLVLPLAPWVFGTAAVAYAIVPQTMAPRVGHWALLYATVLTVATLGAGVLVQPVARRLDHVERPRAILAAMVTVSAGIAVAAAAVALRSPWWGVAAAVILGAAYGVALVAGLIEVQRISGAGDRAALTGVFYALSYVGFLLPALVALVGRWVPTAAELAILSALALAGTLVVLGSGRLPQGSVDQRSAESDARAMGEVHAGSETGAVGGTGAGDGDSPGAVGGTGARDQAGADRLLQPADARA